MVDIDPHKDERGFFARTWCSREFEKNGLPTNFVQASISNSSKSGTVRGMHYQGPPSREGKLLRCIRGRIFDVIIDIRPKSKTFLQHESIELSAESHRTLYVPAGFAHGFQTLEDTTEVFYQMTDFHEPELAGGFRWNDPALSIDWPRPVTVISKRDRNYPDLQTAQFSGFE